jgi:dihydrofolate reductase
LDNHCESYLFAPFNKVYRSPILQVKSGGTILLERKSKTSIHGHSQRISDALKYRFKHVLTDEQTLLRHLFGGSKALDLNHPQSSKILVVGGKDTLKKKIHLGLLAFLLQAASQQIYSHRNSFFVTVEHQESGREAMVNAHIEVRTGSERVAALELERAGEDVARSIISGDGKGEKALRVTKVTVEAERPWHFSIISSNRIDPEFARCLGVDRVCWTINPLIKNYDDVLLTLNSMQQFIRSGPK